MNKIPSLFQIATGLVVTAFTKKNRQVHAAPVRIGRYSLKSHINKNSAFNSYAIGIYTYNKKEYLIKTWQGSVKDYSFYDLQNECVMTKLMKNILKSSAIYVPTVIDIITTKESLSLVTEFIEAKKLADCNPKVQIEVLSKILQIFSQVSENDADKIISAFPVRRALFYFLSLHPLMVLTVLSNLSSISVIWKTYVESLKNLKTLEDRKLYLSHRDISLDNILVKGKTIFLLDSGKAVFTLKNYDFAYMSINPKIENLCGAIGKRVNQPINLFLKDYILLHHARTIGNPHDYDNYYLARMEKEYKNNAN